MNKSVIRLISALLIVLLLIIYAASCGNVDGEEKAPDTTASQTSDDETATDPLAIRLAMDDGLPDRTFDDKTFRILLYNDGSTAPFFPQEEEIGDVVKDAIFTRDREIEERFAVILSYDTTRGYEEVASLVQRTVSSGDNAFELVSSHVVSLSSNALNHVLMNWYDLSYVDFEKPWWSASNINDLTYNGVALIAIGDFAMSALNLTYCMYFDKGYAADYNLGDIYAVVRDGDWTVDRLSGLTKDIYEDVNSSGSKDPEDFFGLGFRIGSHTNAFLWAFDNPIMRPDENSRPILVIKTEKINAILEKLNTLGNENVGSFAVTDYNEAINLFRNGRCVFSLGEIGNSLHFFRDMERDYGIIPLPKWDEAQARYQTCVNGAHEGMAVPLTVEDTEFVGIVTEALCAGTYKGVVPSYYDVALKFKGLRDETSIEILDMIVAGRIFDFGFIYDNWKGAGFILQNLVAAKSNNFESTFAKQQSEIIKHYDMVIEALNEYNEQ